MCSCVSRSASSSSTRRTWRSDSPLNGSRKTSRLLTKAGWSSDISSRSRSRSGHRPPRETRDMSNRASASRYAKALLDVMIREGNPEQAEQELASFADLFAGHEDLRKATLNPAVPATAKRNVLQTRLA